LLIHLFNLRKYKKILFPHTRFFKQLQLNSKQQSKISYRRLLATRLLFLLLLILAFAQPFFGKNHNHTNTETLKVLFVDNSWSLSATDKNMTAFEDVRQKLMNQLDLSDARQKYLLLSNDPIKTFQSQSKEQVKQAINQLHFSGKQVPLQTIIRQAQTVARQEGLHQIELQHFSDFQIHKNKDLWPNKWPEGLSYQAIKIDPPARSNLAIDTAWLLNPMPRMGEDNELVVKVRQYGKSGKDQNSSIRLFINDKLTSAVEPRFNDTGTSLDTIHFSLSQTGWQRLVVKLQDENLRFDDTFRMGIKSSPNLSILNFSNGQPNPFIQTAARAFSGFSLTNGDIFDSNEDWTNYNLILISGMNSLTEVQGNKIKKALEVGTSVAFFPSKTKQFQNFNPGLKAIGDIQISKLDTLPQTVSSLQQGSTLVRGLFEHIPQQMQLPQTNWHYVIKGGLSANGQKIMSFRGGEPFLASFQPSRGSFFLSATDLKMESGNFAGSYFFVPFLYHMASATAGTNTTAVKMGHGQSVFYPVKTDQERNMIHLKMSEKDIIPAQKTSGAGVNVYIDEVVETPGFASIQAKGGENMLIGINPDPAESALQFYSLKQIESKLKGTTFDAIQLDDYKVNANKSQWEGLSLWKLSVLLALIMLMLETGLLASNLSFTKSQPSSTLS